MTKAQKVSNSGILINSGGPAGLTTWLQATRRQTNSRSVKSRTGWLAD